MTEKLFRATKIIVRCVKPGSFKDGNKPAVAPQTEEKPVGALFKASDFEKDEFKAFFDDGTLVEHEVEPETDAASAFYGSSAPAEPETEEKRKERLLNEAKLLGVEGVTKNMKADTIQAKINEHKNVRESDGTTPSTQEGAGRENPSEGETDGEGAGGDADGVADEDADLVG